MRVGLMLIALSLLQSDDVFLPEHARTIQFHYERTGEWHKEHFRKNWNELITTAARIHNDQFVEAWTRFHYAYDDWFDFQLRAAQTVNPEEVLDQSRIISVPSVEKAAAMKRHLVETRRHWEAIAKELNKAHQLREDWLVLGKRLKELEKQVERTR